MTGSSEEARWVHFDWTAPAIWPHAVSFVDGLRVTSNPSAVTCRACRSALESQGMATEEARQREARIRLWMGEILDPDRDEALTPLAALLDAYAKDVVAQAKAEALDIVKRACDIECKSPGTHTGCSSHEPYRALRDSTIRPEADS